jgi:hypothetical protein
MWLLASMQYSRSGSSPAGTQRCVVARGSTT